MGCITVLPERGEPQTLEVFIDVDIKIIQPIEMPLVLLQFYFIIYKFIL